MIKKLIGCTKGYEKETVLTPLFIAFEVIIECIIPFITAKLVDSIKANCSMETIVKYGLLLVAMAAISLTCGALSGYFCATAAAGFSRNLREKIYYRIQDYSFANIDKFSTPSLVTRLTTDAGNVTMAFMMIIRTAIRCPLMMIFAMIMAFVLGGKMAIVFVFVLPVLGFGLFAIIRKAMPLFKRVFKKYDAINESIQENVKGMRVVKAYVREDYEQDKFGRAAEDVAADFTRAEKIVALNGPVMQFCIYSVMIAILIVGSKLIIYNPESGFTLGCISGLLTYGIQMLMSMMMVSIIFVMLTMAVTSAKRIVEVLDEEPTIKNPENPITEVKDGSIEFKNVSFKYSAEAEKYALSDVDIRIKSGETVGIIGGTGSSKTTFIQLISRLYDVSEGEIAVGGVNVKDYDLVALRNEVSVVLQKNILFSGTIKENLRWGDKNATDEEMERVCRLAQADEFIQSFPEKYDTYIEQGGANVSGGQKQRLCIARALLKKPKILILDDSTSAVDTKTDALIRAAMRREIPGTTKIIIAQRISSVMDADKIIVLDGGCINGVGSHDELMATNEIYREVYNSQNKAVADDE